MRVYVRAQRLQALCSLARQVNALLRGVPIYFNPSGTRIALSPFGWF